MYNDKLTQTVMMMELNDYKEMMHDVRRALGSEKERLTERVEQLDGFLKITDVSDELLSQLESLKVENERLNEETDRLRREVRVKEMKLSELSKLSVGVARKSSQDEVLKALRTYLNMSKRKTLSKRVAVKMMIMELANAIGISFPDDMVATLEALDDELSEPKVTVQGNYVENKGVVNHFNAPVGQVVEQVS